MSFFYGPPRWINKNRTQNRLVWSLGDLDRNVFVWTPPYTACWRITQPHINPRRFRKINSGTNCTVLFVYCCTVYKILRLDTEMNVCTMYMHYGIYYELYVFCRKKHTYFRQIKTYAEYYDWVDIFYVHNFCVMVTMCWPETEWFVRSIPHYRSTVVVIIFSM